MPENFQPQGPMPQNQGQPSVPPQVPQQTPPMGTQPFQAPVQPQSQPQPVQPGPTPVNDFIPPGGPAPQGMPTSNSIGGGNKIPLIIGVIVALIIAGVVGFGFWNGSRVKAYAKEADEIVASTVATAREIESSNILNMSFDQISNGSFSAELDELQNQISSFSEKASKDLDDISKKSVPAPAAQLKKDLTEYLTLSKEFGEESTYLLSVMDGAVDAINLMTNINPYSNQSAVAKQLKGAFEKWQNQAKEITPPESMKENHDKLIKALGEITSGLAKGDYDVFYSVNNPFDNLGVDLGEKGDKIDELGEKVKKEASELKESSFVLF